MKIIDKRKLVINNINNNITEIDLLEDEIETKLLDFYQLSKNIASELRDILISEKKDIVNEVLYADEISISKDRLMYLIMIAPKRDISEVSESKIFVREVDNVLNTLKDRYKDSIEIRRTGYAVLGSDEEQTMLSGFWIQILITIIGILIIFFIGFRRLVYPILSFIPLSIGILLMYGFYSITVGTLNIITLIAPILLYGMGIDYAIHFGTRYGEIRAELGKDAPQSEILRETFNSIGYGMVVAVLTTIFAFLSFLTSSIGGLFNFAIITSSGTLFSFLSMMYLLPIIVLWRERKFKKTKTNFISSSKFILLGKLSNSIYGTIISIIIVLVALLLIPFYRGLEIEFEKDAIKMQGLESVKLGEELGERFDQSHSQTAFIVKGYDNVVNFEKELKRRENDVPVYPTINASRTISARKAVREFEKFGWDRDINTLSEYKQKYIDKKGESSKVIADLYEFFVRNYVDWENDDYLVLVNSSGYVWYEKALKAHIKDLTTLEHNTGFFGAGIIKVWWFLTSHMIGDLLIFSIISLVIIVIILAFITKSLKGTLICTTSLLISCLSTLSIMAIFNIRINFANISAFAVIMGLGIDYTIYIYYRLVHESQFDTIDAISSTGKAVLLTTLTTLVSFGVVAFSTHPGIASLGLIISIGLTMCFLSSLFLIPTLVKICYRKQILIENKNIEAQK
jgi:predicted RND superfamily exporter protein